MSHYSDFRVSGKPGAVLSQIFYRVFPEAHMQGERRHLLFEIPDGLRRLLPVAVVSDYTVMILG